MLYTIEDAISFLHQSSVNNNPNALNCIRFLRSLHKVYDIVGNRLLESFYTFVADSINLENIYPTFHGRLHTYKHSDGVVSKIEIPIIVEFIK